MVPPKKIHHSSDQIYAICLKVNQGGPTSPWPILVLSWSPFSCQEPHDPVSAAKGGIKIGLRWEWSPKYVSVLVQEDAFLGVKMCHTYSIILAK